MMICLMPIAIQPEKHYSSCRDSAFYKSNSLHTCTCLNYAMQNMADGVWSTAMGQRIDGGVGSDKITCDTNLLSQH